MKLTMFEVAPDWVKDPIRLDVSKSEELDGVTKQLQFVTVSYKV